MSRNDGSIGKLFRAEDVTVIEWEIGNFSTLSDDADFSPLFSFADTLWFLTIKPCDDYVGLYIHSFGKRCYSIDVTLCLKDARGKEVCRTNFIHTFEAYKFQGESKLCKRSSLMSNGSILLPADVMTVVATMKTIKRCSVPVSLFVRLQTVSRSMKALLNGEKRTDVVLKLKGRIFQAHRDILERGSEVFRAMFSRDMAENRTGEISIDDLEAETFEEVLFYMYTGEVQNLCAYNVCELYKAADKYFLAELKELCKSFMEECMSVDLFCEAVVLADTYNETELMKIAKEFYRRNTTAILQTEAYKEFKTENHATYIQFLESIVIENELRNRNVDAV